MVRMTTMHTKCSRLVLSLWACALTSALALFTARLSAQATPRSDSSFVEAAQIISVLESGKRPNAADGA